MTSPALPVTHVASDLRPAELVHQRLEGRVRRQHREPGEPLVLRGSPGHVVGQAQGASHGRPSGAGGVLGGAGAATGERFGAFVQDALSVTSVEDLEPSHVEAFMDALRMDGSQPEYGTRRVRRMALRMAFRTGRRLGLCRVDPTLDVELGPNASVSARRLFQAEVELCRVYAIPGPRDGRRSVAWALAEATARTGEMGLVRISDLDLARGRVWLPGTPGADARWGYLTDWGLGQVLRRIRLDANPAASLIVWRRQPKNARAASSQAVKETLKAATLVTPEIKPRSVTAWAGRRLFDDGAPLDVVARRLGMRSLDQTASFIGFEWNPQGDA